MPGKLLRQQVESDGFGAAAQRDVECRKHEWHHMPRGAVRLFGRGKVRAVIAALRKAFREFARPSDPSFVERDDMKRLPIRFESRKLVRTSFCGYPFGADSLCKSRPQFGITDVQCACCRGFAEHPPYAVGTVFVEIKL